MPRPHSRSRHRERAAHLGSAPAPTGSRSAAPRCPPARSGRAAALPPRVPELQVQSRRRARAAARTRRWRRAPRRDRRAKEHRTRALGPPTRAPPLPARAAGGGGTRSRRTLARSDGRFPPVLALTGKEIGLGIVGLAFVAFALTSAMLLPRRYPDFPGRSKGVFLLCCFLFFIAMMLAVIFLAKEDEEEPRER